MEKEHIIIQMDPNMSENGLTIKSMDMGYNITLTAPHLKENIMKTKSKV